MYFLLIPCVHLGDKCSVFVPVVSNTKAINASFHPETVTLKTGYLQSFCLDILQLCNVMLLFRYLSDTKQSNILQLKTYTSTFLHRRLKFVP